MTPPAFAPRPPVKRKFWTVPTILVVVFGGLFLVCGLLVKAGTAADNASLRDLDVKMTNCSLGGSPGLRVAKVEFTATNRGKTARRATIHLEYRDAGGARVDTDTAYVQAIAPGDTVRAEESTILNANPSTITCRITGVS